MQVVVVVVAITTLVKDLVAQEVAVRVADNNVVVPVLVQTLAVVAVDLTMLEFQEQVVQGSLL
jgi:hypothetical protein